MSGRALPLVLGLLALVPSCADDGSGAPQSTTTSLAGQALDDLAPGDCLEALPDAATGRADVVDCRVSHRAEVYATHDLDGDGFPGAAVVDEQAAQRCAELYGPYAGEPIDPTTDQAFAELVPSPASWDGGDRRVVCLVLPPGGAAVQGSIAAGAR